MGSLKQNPERAFVSILETTCSAIDTSQSLDLRTLRHYCSLTVDVLIVHKVAACACSVCNFTLVYAVHSNFWWYACEMCVWTRTPYSSCNETVSSILRCQVTNAFTCSVRRVQSCEDFTYLETQCTVMARIYAFAETWTI